MQSTLTLTVGLLTALAFIPGCRSTASKTLSVEAAVGTAIGDHLSWLGFARGSQNNTKIPTVLELARVKSANNKTNYRAILRLSLGGFSGREYETLYFTDVDHDDLKGTMNLGGGPEGVIVSDISLVDGQFKAVLKIQMEKDQTELKLELHPEQGQAASQLAEQIFPDLSVMSSITGTYNANCPGQMMALQVEASKWRKQRGNRPFADLKLVGRTGKVEPEVCGNNAMCLKESFSSGTIDPLGARLTLSTGGLTRNCSINKDQLICDGCVATLDPISSHAAMSTSTDMLHYPRMAHVTPRDDLESDGDLPSMGEYYGFLHHEHTNQYQLVALDLRPVKALQAAFKQTITTGQRLAAVGTVYFGEGDSNEFISYHFKPVVWENQSTFVLDGDGETFLIIDSWKSGTLTGYWYAKTFGRVGSIELQLGSVPPLAQSGRLIDKVSGRYKGKDNEFEVLTTANLSEDPGDFYPLKVNGWARDPDEKNRRRNIIDGSFDFYTQSYAFRLDDGRIIIGRHTDGGLSLHWPPRPRYGVPLTGNTQLFKYQP